MDIYPRASLTILCLPIILLASMLSAKKYNKIFTKNAKSEWTFLRDRADAIERITKTNQQRDNKRRDDGIAALTLA